MTCIVGVVGKRGVLLAADSQSSTDWIKRQDTGSKVFQLSPIMAIAYCGSGRLGQIVKHWLFDALDDPPIDRDLRRWYVRDFAPVLRDVLDEHGHLHVYEENAVEELGDSAFLLAVRDRLFAIEPDFSISENERPFEAMGSGGETAMGALHAEAEKIGIENDPIPDGRLEGMARRAIVASMKTTLYVGGPIRYVKTSIYTPEERTQAKKILTYAPTVRDDEGYHT